MNPILTPSESEKTIFAEALTLPTAERSGYARAWLFREIAAMRR
jgi:hypothetical protein